MYETLLAGSCSCFDEHWPDALVFSLVRYLPSNLPQIDVGILSLRLRDSLQCAIVLTRVFTELANK